MTPYELREVGMFRDQMQATEKLPLAERKANAVRWFRALDEDHMGVAQKIGWLLSGNYGEGSYISACRVLASPRMNQVAWCAITIASVEYGCPAKFAIQAWKKLPVEKRYLVNEAIRQEIADAKREGYCGEIKKNPYQSYEFTATPHPDLRPETRAYLSKLPLKIENRKTNLRWNTLAPGTGARNQNANSYNANALFGGTYYIEPPTYKRREWVLKFSNERAPYLGYGLWHDLQRGGTPNQLKKVAEKHYVSEVLPRVNK